MTERTSAQRVAPYGFYGSSGAPTPTEKEKAVSGETAFSFVYKPAVSFMYLRAFTAYSNGGAFCFYASAFQSPWRLQYA